MASLMSTSNNNDIATLEDFDEDDEKGSKELSIVNKICRTFIIFTFLIHCNFVPPVDDDAECLQEISGITSQLELLTNSLSESDMDSTPISGKKIEFRV